MRKRTHFLIVLLLISLFLNLVLALSYHDAAQDERQLIDELCGSITLSSISASLASLAELIIWGDSTNGVPPLGSPNNNTPLSSYEIEIIKNISSALKKLALSFYDESVTENTYMNVIRSHSNITTINYALLTLQTTTGSIFEKQ